MSDENVELTRQAYAAVGRRDLDAFLELMDPEVVANPRIIKIEGGLLRGHDGIRTWWHEVFKAFPDFHLDVLAVEGDRGVALAHVIAHGHGQGSGAPFEDDIWVASRIRRGKVVWWQTCGSESEAREAARLAEQAMSQENVELALRSVDAFNRRNLDAFLALMDKDVESVSRIVAMEGGLHGHDGIRRWWDSWLDAFPDYKIEVVGVRGLGDVVIATLRALGHGGASDLPFEDKVWHVGRWRDGKCIWWQVFNTEADALEAAGLSE